MSFIWILEAWRNILKFFKARRLNTRLPLSLETRLPLGFIKFRHFFSISFFFTGTNDSQNSRRRDGTTPFFFFFYQGFLSRTLATHRTAGEGRGPSFSTLPLPPAHEHSDICLQLCTWDDFHIFLIATLEFTRLLLDGIYHRIELLFDWLMM